MSEQNRRKHPYLHNSENIVELFGCALESVREGNCSGFYFATYSIGGRFHCGIHLHLQDKDKINVYPFVHTYHASTETQKTKNKNTNLNVKPSR